MAMTFDRSVEVLDAMLDIRGYCNFEQCQAWSTIRAHLSAQGEAVVYQLLVAPGRWEDVGKVQYDADHSHQHRILYTHPAERAAVPDGWVMVPATFTKEMEAAFERSQECCDDSFNCNHRGNITFSWSVVEPHFKKALTATPQPPEGARVDGCNHDWRMQTDRAPPRDKCIECGAVRDSKTHVLLAAPTLAGKEGAK